MKDLEVLVGEKLNMTLQCALTVQNANNILGFIKRSMTSRLSEVVLTLDSRETPPGILRPALEPLAQERHRPVEVGPEEGYRNDEKHGTPLL